MTVLIDDLGTEVGFSGPPRRVVSLVPSLTEALAVTVPDRLVGATDWCTHPADLDVPRVRGTKNPDRAAIAALAPDLVVCNREENRELDVDRLRAAGVPVWVTVIETVDEALASMRRLLADVLEVGEPSWLTAAAAEWARPAPSPSRRVAVPIWRDPWMVVGPRTFTGDVLEVGEPSWLTAAAAEWARPAPSPSRRVAVPIWRDPWMVVGPRTFTGDVLTRLGLVNVFGAGEDRYPHVSVDDVLAAGPDVVLLPDEPYPFTADDGPEAFPGLRSVLVSGRALTWYGPSLATARAELLATLGDRRGDVR
jgi:ABC-type Fe3+-hydroxamate transport system substrate-binding protein